MSHFTSTVRFWFLTGAIFASPLLEAQTGSLFASGAWSGNVTSTSATVTVRLAAPGALVRLAVATTETLTAAKFFGEVTATAANGNTVAIDALGLEPNIDYFYGIEVAGMLRTEANSRGRFRTFPTGPASFRIAVSGDSHYDGPNQSVFTEILAARPLLFLHLGDLHYNDTNSLNPDDYRANYDRVLNQPIESAFYRAVPLAYMWDDHDAMGNDCDGTFVGVPAARAVYGERVPHYPIGPTDGSVGQAFTVGRVRVIMTDTRSAATPSIQAESASKTRLGVAQKNWFKQELISARDAGFPLILWVNPDPWIDPAMLGSDTWAGWATERTEIANFLRANRIGNVVILSADMHSLAYDDGTHSDYATGGGAPLTVLQVAALTEGGTVKGGPYTAGPIAGSQQYGLLDITDTGGPIIQCRFTGRRVGEGVKLIYQFNASAAAIEASVPAATALSATDRALINVSARGRIAAPRDTLIAGFVIAGKSPRNILLRAVGPSLAAFGITNFVTRPALVLFQGSTVIASNDDWGLVDPARLTVAFDRAGAFRYLNTTSRDAAMFLNLPPGAYTVQAGSANNGTGGIVVEVYEVP